MTRTIKVGETAIVYFDVRVENSDQPALNEAGGQPQSLINAGSFTNNGLSPLVSVGFGRYTTALNTNDLSVMEGDVILTRYKGTNTAETAGDTFLVVSEVGTVPDDVPSVAFYGTVGDADLYHNNRITSKKWRTANPDDKRRALIQATQMIDRLNFAGEKVDSSQTLQFPRKNIWVSNGELATTQDVNIPQDIKFATYLVALKLIEGYDPEHEARALAMNMQKYQSVQAIFERKFIPENQVAGIPSAEAWGFLRPYLRDPRQLELLRV
jgi:hypothetical protein